MYRKPGMEPTNSHVRSARWGLEIGTPVYYDGDGWLIMYIYSSSLACVPSFNTASWCIFQHLAQLCTQTFHILAPAPVPQYPTVPPHAHMLRHLAALHKHTHPARSNPEDADFVVLNLLVGGRRVKAKRSRHPVIWRHHPRRSRKDGGLAQGWIGEKILSSLRSKGEDAPR